MVCARDGVLKGLLKGAIGCIVHTEEADMGTQTVIEDEKPFIVEKGDGLIEGWGG